MSNENNRNHPTFKFGDAESSPENVFIITKIINVSNGQGRQIKKIIDSKSSYETSGWIAFISFQCGEYLGERRVRYTRAINVE